MPHYFFDLDDGENVIDDEGLDLSGIEAARCKARGLAADRVSALTGPRAEGCIVVTIRNGPSSVLSILRMICQEEAVGTA